MKGNISTNHETDLFHSRTKLTFESLQIAYFFLLPIYNVLLTKSSSSLVAMGKDIENLSAQLDSPVYFAGQLIQGTVHFDCSEPVKSEGMYLLVL